MNACTWKNKATGACGAPGTVPQLDKRGKQWACLCAEHAGVLEEAVASGNPRAILGAWVCAQGGPSTAAARMRL